MSMTLQDMSITAALTRNLAGSGNPSLAAAVSGTADPVAQALDVASKRTSAQISQTNVELSSYGQIKSGFASMQSTGKALTTLAKNASASDVTKAAQSFVAAFNTTSSAVSTAVEGDGKNAGALANAPLVGISSNDLRRFASNTTGSAALKNIGISTSQNGTLSVDTKALSAAFQANPEAVKSTLAALGQQASTTAAKELSSGGAVGSAVNSLTTRAKSLAAQQAREQSIAASAQATIEQSSNQITNFSSSSGIAAYVKMFSL